MNFDFSQDVTEMREAVRGFLRDHLPTGAVRRQIETGEPFDRPLWSAMSDMGWLGTTIPEAYGGSGLGYEALCMLAEEIGAALPPTPFSSSLYLAAEALLAYGEEDQKRRLLPGIADGSRIGAFALAEGAADPGPPSIHVSFSRGALNGVKLPVFDGGVADFAIIAARTPDGGIGLCIVDLTAPGVTRELVKTLELGRSPVRMVFDNAPAEILPGAQGWDAVVRLLDRAAVLFAFEQVGGAQAALDMAVGYAMERFAFGRPIGSFQAIKHKLADVYVAIELARSNAYFGAWALDNDAPELATAAAAARIAATDAFHLASKENIHTHGGMGFTWDSDCHLFYRRSKQLAGNIGGSRYWRDRLLDRLITLNQD